MSDADEVRAARVEEVFELRLGGAELHDIRQHAARAKDDDGKPVAPWNVSDRVLCRYIAAADKLFAERFEVDAAHLIGRHLLQRRRLYAHAMEVGDFRTALQILKDEAQLEGLYAPKQRKKAEGGRLRHQPFRGLAPCPESPSPRP